MIRAVLFDLDGVLVDSKVAWHAAMNAIRAEMGLPDVTPQALDTAWGQSTAEDAHQFFDSRITEAELTARYAVEFPRHLQGVRAIEEGTGGVLDRLGREGCAMAVTTNAPRITASAMLTSAGLHERLPLIVTPEDVPRAKPAPDMLVEACRRLSVSVEEAVLVGDTAVDLAAGAAAGMPVIGFRLDGATVRIESLEEIPAVLADLRA